MDSVSTLAEPPHSSNALANSNIVFDTPAMRSERQPGTKSKVVAGPQDWCPRTQSHIVTIVIGVSGFRLQAHTRLLAAVSPFFERALCGTYLEAHTGILEMPTEDPGTFLVFLRWLYSDTYWFPFWLGPELGFTGHWTVARQLLQVLYDRRFETVCDELYEWGLELDPVIADFLQRSDHESLPGPMELFCFADRYAISDSDRSGLPYTKGSKSRWFSPDAIVEAYENLPSHSIMRLFLIDSVVNHFIFTVNISERGELYPQERRREILGWSSKFDTLSSLELQRIFEDPDLEEFRADVRSKVLTGGAGWWRMDKSLEFLRAAEPLFDYSPNFDAIEERREAMGLYDGICDPMHGPTNLHKQKRAPSKREVTRRGTSNDRSINHYVKCTRRLVEPSTRRSLLRDSKDDGPGLMEKEHRRPHHRSVNNTTEDGSDNETQSEAYQRLLAGFENHRAGPPTPYHIRRRSGGFLDTSHRAHAAFEMAKAEARVLPRIDLAEQLRNGGIEAACGETSE